jgi:hypothetical protein
MTKRVFRYFFNFTDGQEKWLNEMAAKGWRLIKCGQLTYDFERCAPGEYEYAVEFVADKSYAKSKDYKAFLESMGYKTFYKNVNVGIFYGKAKWRPWGEGAGQIATAPGSFQKELIIVEKKKDGKSFELHTDLTDSLTLYRKIRMAYFWYAGVMFGLALMFSVYTVRMKSFYMALGAVLCGALGFLWLIPGMQTSQKVRRLKEEAKTNEYEATSMKKKVLQMIAAVAIPILLASLVFGALYVSGAQFDSYSARGIVQSSWGNHWNASYIELNGYKQRRVSLNEGTYIFTIETTTKSGELNLSITGQDGTEYYKGSKLPTSTFEVQVDIAAKDKLTLRVDAKGHSGGFKMKWE